MKGETNTHTMSEKTLSERVTINVSGAEGFLITIIDSNGNIITTSTEDSFSIDVPHNTVYTVSASTVEGYTKPDDITYTASLLSRAISLIYYYGIGIFIQGVSGKLYTESEWSGQETANGIAVCTEACRFVMALNDAAVNKRQWGGDGTTISGIVTTTVQSEAMKDYAGESNTTAILNQLGNNSTNAPAAYSCRSYTFPNGYVGYMGALGEWQAVLNNKDAIISILEILGCGYLYNAYHTSTQYDSNNCWAINWTTVNAYSFSKDEAKGDGCYVRAFTAI